MTLDEFLGIGKTEILGHHTFTAEEIKRFAAKYDPQRFHLDEEIAKASILGGLCASGWHSACMWMRYNVLAGRTVEPDEWSGPGPCPSFGPSPGIRDLKWLQPIYAGQTITFSRTGLEHDPHPDQPGWRVLSVRAEALDAAGKCLLHFIWSVMVDTSGGAGPA